jgi:hypothetical protein
MSLNPFQRMMIARGMGALGDGPWVDPAWSDANLGPPPPINYPSSSSSGFNWNQFANVVGGTLVGVLGNRNAPQQQYALQPQGQQPQVVYVQPNAAGGAGGVGIGIDGQGIRLSDGSHIGWLPIALVGGAFFLLQSPGFSRKR